MSLLHSSLDVLKECFIKHQNIIITTHLLRSDTSYPPKVFNVITKSVFGIKIEKDKGSILSRDAEYEKNQDAVTQDDLRTPMMMYMKRNLFLIR